VFLGKATHPVVDHKMLRFCQAGLCYPSRQARTNRELPHGSALAANRDPRGFLGKGDVMIHRPCLVAWPVGSDWRTRHPDWLTHHKLEEKQCIVI
jgi:hypothetical protein